MIERCNPLDVVLRTVLLLLITAAAASVLLSCGMNRGPGNPGGPGGTHTPPPAGGDGGTTISQPQGHLAVADSGDNRILIFNTPLSATESPNIVIGQTSFNRGEYNQGRANPNAATLNDPGNLALDSAGNLWVTDIDNCRVLEFQPPFTTGMSASLVIGEPDFKTTGSRVPDFCLPQPSISAASLEWPVSVAFDGHGDLWVTDIMADRITEYVPPFSNGMAASLVIGKPTLENAEPCSGGTPGGSGPIPAPTAATLCDPGAITFDSQGDLWGTDEGNVRILEFVPPFSTGMSASLEMVGQPPSNFASNGATCNDGSASSFCYLDAIAFDRNGDLWVSDGTFDRVLEFAPPFSNGMEASLVIKQHNYTETGNDVGASPGGLFFDGSGNLIVSDEVSLSAIPHGRIQVYSPPFTEDMDPKITMTGQQCTSPTYTIVNANSLCGPGNVVKFP